MRIVVHPDCPKDRAYMVDGPSLGMLLQYPSLAQTVAEGGDPCILAPNKEVADKVATAVRSVVRVDL